MGGGGKVMTCDCCDKSLIRRIVPSGQPRRSRSVTRLQTQDSGHSPTCKTHITLFFLYFVFLVFANDCTSRIFIFFILQLYSSYKLPPWDHNLHWQQLGKSSFCSHIHNRVLSHKLMKSWSLNFENLSVAFWGLMASKAAEWVGSISQTQCWPPGLHCLQGANHPPHILTNHQLLYYNIKQQRERKEK